MSAKRVAAGRSNSRGVAVGVAFIFSIGLAFNGLNNAAGNPIIGLLGAATLAVLIALATPSAVFWKRVAPVIALVTAAMVWATLQLWVPSLAGSGVVYLVPDLLGSELLAHLGYLAALLSGCLLARRRGAVGTTIDSLLLFGCVNILMGLLLRGMPDAGPWDFWQSRPDGRFTGTLSNSNVAGTYYGALAALALSRVVSLRAAASDRVSTIQRVVYWLALLLTLGGCTITGSRSAIAFTLVALLFIAVRPLLSRNVQRLASSPLLLLLLAAGAVLATGLADLLLARFELLSTESTLRPLMLSHYGRLAQDSPLFGYGLGSFPALNARSLTDPRTAQALWTVNSAHNLPLQLVLQGGLPYFALLIAAALWIGRGVTRSLAFEGYREGRDGALAAIFIMLGCSMVDIVLDVPAMVAFALLLTGLLWSPLSGGQYPHRARARHASAA